MSVRPGQPARGRRSSRCWNTADDAWRNSRARRRVWWSGCSTGRNGNLTLVPVIVLVVAIAVFGLVAGASSFRR